ncbi:MAG: leucine-rich repeat domain-containing protein, partial [Muribaculaceae bacterium]|nr:leucine-rich repeat domain-containing protein [Muribaculaceae bacterium]
MKKFLLFLVASMLATASHAFVYEKLSYNILPDGTVELEGSGIASGDIVIPEIAIDGLEEGDSDSAQRYVVTRISERAFYGCSNLTSVIIPSTVTSIGDNAFDNCSSLT